MIFGKTKIAQEEFYGAKKPIKILNVNADNIVISKLIEKKNNSTYLTGCLDDVIRSLVLTLPKMSAYFKTLKDKDGDKDKSKNNKLISL